MTHYPHEGCKRDAKACRKRLQTPLSLISIALFAHGCAATVQNQPRQSADDRPSTVLEFIPEVVQKEAKTPNTPTPSIPSPQVTRPKSQNQPQRRPAPTAKRTHNPAPAPPPPPRTSRVSSIGAYDSPWELHRFRNGITAPYPLKRIFRGFGKCRRGVQKHQAIDIAGVGKDWGLGTPVRAMVRSRVTFIGLPEDNPKKFGRRDMGKGKVVRSGSELPRRQNIPPYGMVRFFTLEHGSSRTGVLLKTRGLDTPLKGHTIRYMHLAAVHPDLKPGVIIEAGQEIGLMGGTAIQESPPHVHIDIANTRGNRVDVAPLLGLPGTRKDCGKIYRAERSAKRRPRKLKSDPDLLLAERDVWTRSVDADLCEKWTRREDFASGRYIAHDLLIPLDRKDRKKNLLLTLIRHEGRFKPRLMLLDTTGEVLFDGRERTTLGKKKSPGLKIQHDGSESHQTWKITMRRPKTLIVRITGWGNGVKSKRPDADAVYGFHAQQQCGNDTK